MTTNYIDKLDAALVRPGRCDVVSEITYATREQIKAMYDAFQPKISLSELLNSLPQQTTMAEVQQHLMQNI